MILWVRSINATRLAQCAVGVFVLLVMAMSWRWFGIISLLLMTTIIAWMACRGSSKAKGRRLSVNEQLWIVAKVALIAGLLPVGFLLVVLLVLEAAAWSSGLVHTVSSLALEKVEYAWTWPLPDRNIWVDVYGGMTALALFGYLGYLWWTYKLDEVAERIVKAVIWVLLFLTVPIWFTLMAGGLVIRGVSWCFIKVFDRAVELVSKLDSRLR